MKTAVYHRIWFSKDPNRKSGMVARVCDPNPPEDRKFEASLGYAGSLPLKRKAGELGRWLCRVEHLLYVPEFRSPEPT